MIWSSLGGRWSGLFGLLGCGGLLCGRLWRLLPGRRGILLCWRILSWICICLLLRFRRRYRRSCTLSYRLRRFRIDSLIAIVRSILRIGYRLSVLLWMLSIRFVRLWCRDRFRVRLLYVILLVVSRVMLLRRLLMYLIFWLDAVRLVSRWVGIGCCSTEGCCTL